MKNIHILPTDKPSRLHDYNYTDLLGLSKEYLQWRQGMHIYITSNEIIKERDYVLSDTSIGALYLDGVVNTVEMLAENQWKKVILTTDQDLIKNGVQAVDDDFLKWFISNPSCEEVEVKSEILWLNKRFGGTWQPFPDEEAIKKKKNYKIITPKKVVKHEARVLSKEEVMSERSSAYEFIDFDNQEPLIEAFNIHYKTINYTEDSLYKEAVKRDFIAGAKWQLKQDIKKFSSSMLDTLITDIKGQKERSYSEEDLHNLMDSYQNWLMFTNAKVLTFREWFEKNKKK